MCYSIDACDRIRDGLLARRRLHRHIQSCCRKWDYKEELERLTYPALPANQKWNATIQGERRKALISQGLK